MSEQVAVTLFGALSEAGLLSLSLSLPASCELLSCTDQ